MSDFSLMENLRAKYAQRDALVLQRVQEYQTSDPKLCDVRPLQPAPLLRDIEEPLTFCEVVDDHDFLSPLYWEDGVVDDVQAYCAYLFYAEPFGEEDSTALSNALFEYHMSEQEASFGWAVDDIKEDLALERHKKKKEDSHIAA